MTTTERAVAAMVAQNGAVQLDAASPIVDDTIPDGDEVKFTVTKERSAACCRQLLGDLKAIEEHPGQRHLQKEFAARRDALFERMTPADRVVVAAEADRVRALVKPRSRRRKQSEPEAA